MNYSIVRYIIGKVLYFEAAFMGLPCVTAIIYQEHSGWAFFFTALLCILLAYLLTRKRPANDTFYVKEGCSELDCFKYYGRASFFVLRFYYKSCGCPV